MNGYELRLEMLKMAKELMMEKFMSQKEHSTTEYYTFVEANKGDPEKILSKELISPEFPMIENIVKQAEIFNEFVVKK